MLSLRLSEVRLVDGPGPSPKADLAMVRSSIMRLQPAASSEGLAAGSPWRLGAAAPGARRVGWHTSSRFCQASSSR